MRLGLRDRSRSLTRAREAAGREIPRTSGGTQHPKAIPAGIWPTDMLAAVPQVRWLNVDVTAAIMPAHS